MCNLFSLYKLPFSKVDQTKTKSVLWVFVILFFIFLYIYIFELNREKYLFVPCTIFESHYCYSIFGIHYSTECKANKRKAYWINKLQDEWTNSQVIPRELKWHYSDPSRQPQRGSVQVTNMLDLLQSTSIFKNVMLTWGKTWSSPSQTIICQPTLIG